LKSAEDFEEMEQMSVVVSAFHATALPFTMRRTVREGARARVVAPGAPFVTSGMRPRVMATLEWFGRCGVVATVYRYEAR